MIIIIEETLTPASLSAAYTDCCSQSCLCPTTGRQPACYCKSRGLGISGVESIVCTAQRSSCTRTHTLASLRQLLAMGREAIQATYAKLIYARYLQLASTLTAKRDTCIWKLCQICQSNTHQKVDQLATQNTALAL